MLVLMSFLSRSLEDSSLKGFWRADPQFCEKAELEMFMLYLGDNTGYLRNIRYGYLLAANDKGLILNNPIKITFSGNMNVLPGMSRCKNYNACIDWLDESPGDDVFPSEFQATYYPKYGKIVFYQDSKVLAILWKDCQMSSLQTEDELLPDSVEKQKNNDGVDI